jgi:hypothetical protein
LSRAKCGVLDVVSLGLSSREETSLLRACPYSGDRGRAAWEEARALWAATEREAGQGAVGVTAIPKSLGPLLLIALLRNGAVIGGALQTGLRMAYVAEEARSTTYRRVCRNVLSALTAASIPAIVLRGAALADSVYDDPVLRHCHDIDLLVSRSDLRRAATLCRSQGFAPAMNGRGHACEDVRLDHTSVRPLQLDSRLYAIPYFDTSVGDVRSCVALATRGYAPWSPATREKGMIADAR